MSGFAAAASRVEQANAQVREVIIFGRLFPGQRLRTIDAIGSVLRQQTALREEHA